TLYLYYYGWDRWKKGRAKLGHWTLGILLNLWGTIVMFIANSWLTYMMSPPRDITPTTDPTTIKLWHAIANATWMPINVHRVIAVLFLTGNYYLWIGMGRIPGAERFRPYTKYLLMVLVLGAIVWGTPHTMIADSKELAAMGGSHHPFLGALGVMSAKNTAVNLMILTTF